MEARFDCGDVFPETLKETFEGLVDLLVGVIHATENTGKPGTHETATGTTGLHGVLVTTVLRLVATRLGVQGVVLEETLIGDFIHFWEIWIIHLGEFGGFGEGFFGE